MKVDLKRKFLDNIKKSDTEIHSLLFEKLKLYVDERNNQFNKFNNFVGDKYKDFKLFNIDLYINIRDTYNPDTLKVGNCLIRKRSYTELNSVVAYNSEVNYQSATLGIENLFYKEYSFNMHFNKFDWNKIRGVSKEYIQYYFYDTLLYLIPTLYKELSNILYEKLEINKDNYYIEFDKLYNREDLKSKYDCSDYFDKWDNKIEPYININLHNIFNIETGDIYEMEDKYNIYTDNRNYRYNYNNDENASFILFPFSNNLYMKYNMNENKYNGEAFNYSYNKMPMLYSTKTIEGKEVKIEDNLSKFIPNGY